MDEGIRKINSLILTEEEVVAGEGAVVLDPNDLDRAIIGIAHNADGEVVFCYSYDKLVEVFSEMFDESDSEDLETEVIGWIEFNVIRSLPYMGRRAPLVLEQLEEPDIELDCPIFEFNGIRYVPYYMVP